MKKTLGLVTAVGLLAAILVGCSGSPDHNDADVTFAQQMVPHHEQAVGMADSALEVSKSQELRALATRIKAAQGPEIARMNGWLDGWNAGKSDHGAMAGMEHGDAVMGMMTDPEMASLDDATGQKFDTTWLTLMIRHHEGAVAMARSEHQNGNNSAARKLAAGIITGQEAEIATMKGMVKR